MSDWVEIKDLGLVGWQPDLIGPGKALNSFDRAVNVRPIGNNLQNAGGYGFVVGYGESCIPDQDFTGEIAEANWTAGADPSAVGTSVVWNGVASVELLGSDDEGGGNDGTPADVWIEITPTRSGAFTFSWVWEKQGVVGEGSLHDPFGYTIDGGPFTTITRDCDTGCDATESGATSISVAENQTLRMIVRTTDNNGGAAKVLIQGVSYDCVVSATPTAGRAPFFPTYMFGLNSSLVYRMADTLTVLRRNPLVLGGTAAVTDNVNALDGKTISVDNAVASFQAPLVPSGDNLRYRVIAFRFYLPTAVDVNVGNPSLNFFNLYSPPTEITSVAEERGIYFRFTSSVLATHQPGLYFEIRGDGGASSSRVTRSISTGPSSISAGFHTLVFQFGNDVAGSDVDIYLDKIKYEFDIYTWSLDETPDYDNTHDHFIGCNPLNATRYPSNTPWEIDNLTMIYTLNFPGTVLSSVDADAIADAMNSAELNPLPGKLTGLPLWDLGLSGPLVDESSSPVGSFSPDQLSYSLSATDDRRWVTLVTDRALPSNANAKVAVRISIQNPDGIGVSELLEGVVLGITGDTRWDIPPYNVTGFGDFVGTLPPGLGVLANNASGQGRIYQEDYNYLVGQIDPAFPASVLNIYDLVVDMGAKTFNIFIVNGCGQGLTQALPFDFKDDYIRFAVSLRRPIGGGIGATIVRTDTYCDGEEFPDCVAAY